MKIEKRADERGDVPVPQPGDFQPASSTAGAALAESTIANGGEVIETMNQETATTP